MLAKLAEKKLWNLRINVHKVVKACFQFWWTDYDNFQCLLIIIKASVPLFREKRLNLFFIEFPQISPYLEVG